MESAENPKHVAALQVFQLPQNAPRAYLKNITKAFKQAPVSAPFDQIPFFPRLGMPRWRKHKGMDKKCCTYPISTLLPGSSLNATVLSQGNSIDFGMLAEKHMMPDLDAVAEAIKCCFAELELDLLGTNSFKVNASALSSPAKAAVRKRGVTSKKKVSLVKTKARAKQRPLAKAKARTKARTKAKSGVNS